MACLAATCACLGEMLAVEHARARLLRDRVDLSEVSLKTTEDRIEAERIVTRRMDEAGLVQSGGHLLFLLPASGAPAAGAVAWRPDSREGWLRVAGVAPGDYTLWLAGPGPSYPCICGTLSSGGPDGAAAALRLPEPVVDGCRFALTPGIGKGPRPAMNADSIVLASPPYAERIPSR